jgi:FRG domain-containing protein
MNEYSGSIASVEYLVNLTQETKTAFFRGHSKACGKLVPRVFRPDVKIFEACEKCYERWFFLEFRRIAPGLEKRLPRRSDGLSWLFLMQHYGAPTRLLDWTENPLVALYFSVNEQLDQDGELWILEAARLNFDGLRMPGFPLPNNPSVSFLVEKATDCLSDTKLLEKFGLKNPPILPIAIYPTLTFLRMISQSSVFNNPQRDKT